MLLWLLRPPILAGLNEERTGRAPVLARIVRGFGLSFAGVASVAVLSFSILLATFPTEWRAFPLFYIAAIEPEVANKLVFGVVDPGTGIITGNWPSNTLRLQHFDIYEALKVDDPKKLEWKDHIFDLHSRQLEGAVFYGAKVGKVNLEGANLEGAWLGQVKLRGASLDEAQLRGASLDEAQLQDASLKGESFRARRSKGQSFRARRSMTRSFRARHSKMHSCRERRSMVRSFRMRRSSGQSFKARRSKEQSFRARCSKEQSFRARRSGKRSFRAHRSKGQSFRARRSHVAANAADLSHTFLWRTNWGTLDSEKLGAVLLKDVTWKPALRTDDRSLGLRPD